MIHLFTPACTAKIAIQTAEYNILSQIGAVSLRWSMAANCIVFNLAALLSDEPA